MKVTFEFNNEDAKIFADTIFSGLEARRKELRKVAKVNDVLNYHRLSDELMIAYELYASLRNAMGD